MKYLSYLTCLVLALLTTGCFEMFEDLYVNADGSGKYQITIDMSSMFSDPMMGEMMKQGLTKETGEEALEIDSLFSFSELSEGELPPTLTDKDRDILDRTEMRMRMSESEKVGKITITFPFKDFNELNAFNETMAKMDDEEGQSGMTSMMGGSTNFTGGETLWDLSGRTLTRTVTHIDSETLAEQMGGEETMEMAKMMMADATFTTTYHLPGRVKKCSIPNAKINGKEVALTYDLLDFLEEAPETSGTIKFKKN